MNTGPDNSPDSNFPLLPGPAFVTTRWSRVLLAGKSEDPASAEALEELCRAYWPPLYAFARRKGHSVEDAQDLVQDFLCSVLERKALRNADPSRGRFRSFLLAGLKNHRLTLWRKACALKRNRGVKPLPLDELGFEEQRLIPEPAERRNPESEFNRRWAEIILSRALSRVRAAYEKVGKGELFERLEAHLLGDTDAATYESLSQALKRPLNTIKSDMHRLKADLREQIREEVAETVADDQSFEAELREFKQLFD